MMDFVKAKRHYIMALAILFVVVSLSGTTYSLFINVDTTEEFNYNTGILDLKLIEDEQINIENAFPMIDSDGLKTTPYKLTIKNTGTLPYLFDLKMMSSIEENVLDMKYIKFQVNNGKTNTLYATNNIIASNIMLYPEEEITFNDLANQEDISEEDANRLAEKCVELKHEEGINDAIFVLHRCEINERKSLGIIRLK